MKTKPIKLSPQLRAAFKRYGHLHSKRKAGTKKGWEVRFVFGAFQTLPFIQTRTLLFTSGFKPGKRWYKGWRKILPVYGRAAYEAFARL